MAEDSITEEELTSERTPKGLLDWVEAKIDQVASTDDGERAIRLREGLAKQLVEELRPLAIFAFKKYGEADWVGIRPVIGSQNYDAILTDYSCSPASVNYVEVTQAHEGEVEHLRALHLQSYGYVPGTGTIKKIGTKRTRLRVMAELKAEAVTETVELEFQKILNAIRLKEGKNYPDNTFLVIKFDDGHLFRRVANDAIIDRFVHNNIVGLDLCFNELYLVGKFKTVFRQYGLIRDRGQIVRIVTK